YVRVLFASVICDSVFFFFFFFFQAEDGIRDATVTGVQTCALPISFKQTVQRTISEPASASSTVCLNVDAMSAVSVLVMDCTTMRSEERRVGKECRSRWARCH